MLHAAKGFKLFALLGAFLATTPSRGDEKMVQVGDLAPQFQCLDDQGKIWNLQDHVGRRRLVVYFYPSDFAFCCTRQARCYRDCQQALVDQDVEVVAVSGDSVEAHRLFKDAHRLPFTLLADRDGGLARQFGVPLRTGGKCMPQDDSGVAFVDPNGKPLELMRQFTAARWTFIIGPDGRILYRNMGASPIKDGQDVLEFLGKRDAK